MDFQPNRLADVQQAGVYARGALVGLALYALTQRSWLAAGVGGGLSTALLEVILRKNSNAITQAEGSAKRLGKSLAVGLITAATYAATQRYVPALVLLGLSSFVFVSKRVSPAKPTAGSSTAEPKEEEKKQETQLQPEQKLSDPQPTALPKPA